MRVNKWLTPFKDNYVDLVLSAIVVIIMAFLIADFWTKKDQQIAGGEKVSIPQTENSNLTYDTLEGDSLYQLSQKFYGDGKFWSVIARANNIADPDLIAANSSLRIPDKNEADRIWADLNNNIYQVKEGDTLFDISQRVYGDGSRWTDLDSANQFSRLPNGEPLVYAGSTIVIPR